MNDSWGFNITDRRYKSVPELIRYLVKAAGRDANLLLNIGPRPDGTIPPEAEERLRELGRWITTYGGSIYGTRRGPISPRDWGVTTERGDTVFVHVLDWPDRVLALPTLGARVVGARMFATGERVEARQSETGVVLTLPAGSQTSGAEDPDRVVVLTLEARRK
jgi:alpha-L-fucosidase